ncbi:hypothetical protein B932_3238 [Gluconobacter oxydans H24]|nr:hypothetical protein B932_3238 [Gluconobacter oxydans H24]
MTIATLPTRSVPRMTCEVVEEAVKPEWIGVCGVVINLSPADSP